MIQSEYNSLIVFSVSPYSLFNIIPGSCLYYVCILLPVNKIHVKKMCSKHYGKIILFCSKYLFQRFWKRMIQLVCLNDVDGELNFHFYDFFVLTQMSGIFMILISFSLSLSLCLSLQDSSHSMSMNFELFKACWYQCNCIS